jgi:hypothetical protein
MPLPVVFAEPAAASRVQDDSAPPGAWSAWSPQRQHVFYELHVAPAWYRPMGSPEPGWMRGWEVGAGQRVTTRIRPVLLSYSIEPALRILDSKSYAFSFLQRVDVAVALGPLELQVGGGLSTLTIDAIHGDWSAELFSPRAEAGGALRLGSLRIGAHAYSEYLWRWFGNTSYLLRGIAFELGFDTKH